MRSNSWAVELNDSILGLQSLTSMQLQQQTECHITCVSRVSTISEAVEEYLEPRAEKTNAIVSLRGEPLEALNEGGRTR